ncbi:MAG TPA: hypothetical protein VFU12_14590 [Glycomyces sp.]|nr:hypothetical protein [Glycomyces sp.]
MTETTGRPRVLALWSAPRCRSTAFARMMIERGDFTVLHEPFSRLMDFGAVAVADAEVRSEPDLIAAIRELSRRGPVFFKDTTDFRFPGLLEDRRFLAEATHSFIVRDPAAAIASHYALNPDLKRDEVGFARLHEIYRACAPHAERPPAIISAEDLVERPEALVRAYCRAVGVPFMPEALSWRPGMDPGWERTRRWHESVGRTAGFTGGSGSYRHTVDNHETLAEYFDHHLPYYRSLYRDRLLPLETDERSPSGSR